MFTLASRGQILKKGNETRVSFSQKLMAWNLRHKGVMHNNLYNVK